MKKRVILIIVVAAAGAGVLYTMRGSSHRAGDRVVVSGNIELTEVNIAFKTAG
ncbi:MAG: hemolysin secretion protein D, partial [Acidobacteria bacterium Pan2503]|nr:hemolysin secretion protein D [Candidatus Acidoferrum panamensis]